MHIIEGWMRPQPDGIWSGWSREIGAAGSDRVFEALLRLLPAARSGAGRPCKYDARTELAVTLLKLRHNLTYRLLERLTGIDAATACRIVQRTLARLVRASLLRRRPPVRFFIVDSTVSRVGTPDQTFYSGYKHHKGMKTQILCDDRKRIHHVSQGCPASVHDKRLWNRTLNQIRPLLKRTVLADKAYAGARLENEWLFRPIRRNEKAYRMDRISAKAANRQLSKRRVRIEHVMASLKRYRILRDRFPLALNLYTPCMHVVALIHNLEIELKCVLEL